MVIFMLYLFLSADLIDINFFKIFFQKYYQSVNRLDPDQYQQNGQIFCWS